MNLGKDPGVADGSTPDHDRIASGLVAHGNGIFCFFNVPVTDHRNGYLLF